MKKYISIFVLLVLFASCKRDQYNLYDGGGIIQFGPILRYLDIPMYEFNDTVKSYTFFYEPEEKVSDTVYFDIYALGGPQQTDRPFVLRQTSSGTAEQDAVPGKHYVPFDDPSLKEHYIIKAGSIHALVPIVLIRDQALKQESVALTFVVEDNEWFRKGEKTKLWRRLVFTDRLTRPPAWYDLYFGKYSTVKHAYMIEWTGEKWDQEFMQKVAIGQINYAAYWRLKLREALAEYNNMHPNDPLKDEFGDLVVFP